MKILAGLFPFSKNGFLTPDFCELIVVEALLLKKPSALKTVKDTGVKVQGAAVGGRPKVEQIIGINGRSSKVLILCAIEHSEVLGLV
ncbi:MAG: hypothetical protein OIF38_15420 [Cellvibrionaceae bacterium]|nr:hypothetical protein [Cellvibrionaceae bacterium]